VFRAGSSVSRVRAGAVLLPCRGARAAAADAGKRAGGGGSHRLRERKQRRQVERRKGGADRVGPHVSGSRRREGGVRRALREAGSDQAGGGVLSGPAYWAVRVEQASW